MTDRELAQEQAERASRYWRALKEIRRVAFDEDMTTAQRILIIQSVLLAVLEGESTA